MGGKKIIKPFSDIGKSSIRHLCTPIGNVMIRPSLPDVVKESARHVILIHKFCYLQKIKSLFFTLSTFTTWQNNGSIRKEKK